MARLPTQTVSSASVGGAASTPIDPSVRVAPLRDADAVEAAERRDAARGTPDPWDPWPAQRIGYEKPALASLFLPPRRALDRLYAYLERVS